MIPSPASPLASPTTAQRSQPPPIPLVAPVTELQPFPLADQFDPALAAFLDRASDQLCHWLAGAGSASPLPALNVLPAVEPEALGLPAERLLADLQRVMEGAYQPNHPGALAHLDPPALSSSLAADLICAGLNNNLLAEELSPSLSRLERSLCSWLARSLGFPAGASGVPASGGSLSNLMALVVARQSRGLNLRNDAVVLCSADAHLSLAKALVVMGLPPSALRCLPVDGRGRLDPGQLEQNLLQLECRGVPVIAVVATAGTTVRGAVDPLSSLAEVCQRLGHWLHVDGAIGAVVALSPQHCGRVEGLGLADSLTINPQKLLGITKTSSLLVLARPELLPMTFATGLPYMEPSLGGSHGGEAGLQGSRPAEILKLWLGLRQLGLSGIAALVDGAIQRRQRLGSLLAMDDRLNLLPGDLHLLAFRPHGLDPGGCERWSLQTRQALLDQQLMLSRPLYQGRHHLKAVLGNPYTQPRHLEALAHLIHTTLTDG